MRFDVVVAGAGPVGLMLASELGLRGVSVLVVERLAEPDLTIKAGAINVPSYEALVRRGLRDTLERSQERMLEKMAGMFGPSGTPDLAAMRERMRTIGGHFGGLFKLDPTRVDPADPDLIGIDNGTITGVAQQEIERILIERAEELGVEIVRGRSVVHFEQSDVDVAVRLDDGATVSGKWLLGCDGGRSTVRKLAGFDFPGTEPTITGHQAMVDMPDADKLPKGWNRTPVGMLVHGPMAGRILLVQFDGPPPDRDAPVTQEELRAS
ncbi:MAG: FAD-dependent oxidoreductase, partial [Sciscionella sp.]